MRIGMLGLVGLIVLAGPAAAQMGGMGGMGGRGGGMGPGGPPMQEEDSSQPRYQGPRGMKAISQEKFDKAVTAMFKAADTNHDGIVTLAELQAIIEARREAVIRARFKEIDANHDGRIDAEEFIAWQEALGSAASSACASYAGQDRIVPEALGPELGTSEQDDALRDAILPLSALTLTKANIHYRPGITLADLLAFEDARFAQIDSDHDGYLDQDEIEALRHPAPPPAAHPGPAGHRGPPGAPLPTP